MIANNGNAKIDEITENRFDISDTTSTQNTNNNATNNNNSENGMVVT
jgi:hypothetical protein